MNVKSVEKQEKNTVELVIEVSHEEFEAAIDKVYRKQRGKISVPGFRKGKAPRKVIEGMYGFGVFYEDAINESYIEYYEQAAKQAELDAVSWPQVEVLDVGKDGYTFKAVVAVRPEVTLGEYKGLTAEKEAVKVTDEDVENELKPFISRATRMVTVEREARLGDTVVIDFEGIMDGKPFEGGHAEGHSLELGSGSFVPGFEDQLVGVKAGEEKDLDITFPEDYHPDMAGKSVVFKVRVNEVKEAQPPVVDDEFAKDMSEFDTLEAFKKDLAEKIQGRREVQAKHAFEESLIRQAMDNMQVEIPDAMVDFRGDQMINDMAQRMAAQGIAFDQYVAMMGMTPETMRESVQSAALEQIRRELLLDAVVAAESITVSDEEMDAEYASMAEQYGMELDKVKEGVPAESVRRQLTTKKAEAVIVESGKVGKAPSKKKAPAKKKTEKVEKEAAEEAKAEAEGEEKPKKRTTRKKAEGSAEGEEKPKKRTTKKKEEEKTEE